MKIIGIYKINSKYKPERIYIGSSININSRWGVHIRNLRKGIHHSSKLQRHFDKYGETDLCFSILLKCNNKDLIKIEQFFIDSYNPYFNECKIAGSKLGTFHSEETKQKMRKQHNLTDSGKKVCAMKNKSKEAREKLRITHLGEKNPMYHKSVSEETRNKLRISVKKAWDEGKLKKRIL